MEATLQSDDAAIKAASIDILSYLVDFSTAMVSERITQFPLSPI